MPHRPSALFTSRVTRRPPARRAVRAPSPAAVVAAPSAPPVPHRVLTPPPLARPPRIPCRPPPTLEAHRIASRTLFPLHLACTQHGQKEEGESPFGTTTNGIQHRKQGRPRQGRLVEVVDAVRNRAKAKHRKALVSWVSRLPAAKPNICWSTGCIGGGIRANFSDPSLGRSAGLRGNTVAAENARTRR